MRDSCSASSLAIIEKKDPQKKPGGCVGIFFQLFDWKKKKHFSKKLLPPVTAAKRVLRKLGGHEKLTAAKHLPVPRENGGGGYAAVKRSETSTSCSSQDTPVDGLCAPSLVARLMGLESMPIVHHGKTRNDLDSKSDNVHNKASDLERFECRKIGSRPQKLPKTGNFFKNRRPSGNAGRFDSDALQFDMSVEQQRRLALLLKRQKMPSKRKKARLMEVATKILEPGLQSRNRVKFAITNVGVSLNHAEGSDAPFLSKKPDEPLHYDFHVGSCANCGNLVEVMDLRSSANTAHELDHRHTPLDSNDGSSSSSSSFVVVEENKLTRTVIPSSDKRERTIPIRGEDIKRSSLHVANSRNRAAPLAVKAKINVHSRERKCSIRNDQDKCRTHDNVASKSAVKQNNSRQNQLPSAKEKFVSGSKEGSGRHNMRGLNAMGEAKKFAASNKSLEHKTLMTCRTRTLRKSVMKLGKGDIDNDNMVPKRKPHTVSDQMTNGAFMKQRSLRKELAKCKISGSIPNHPRNHSGMRKESFNEVEAGKVNREENSTFSPTFSSQMRHTLRSTSHQNMVERSKCFDELSGCTSSKELVSNAERENMPSQNEKHIFFKMEENTLFAYLEDMITDLSYLEQDNLHTQNYFPGISALLILERMISTLLNRGSPSQRNANSSKKFPCTASSDSSVFNGQSAKITPKNQVDAKAGTNPVPSASCNNSPSLMPTVEVSLPSDGCYCCKSYCRSECSGNKIHERERESSESAPLINISKFHIDKLPSNIGKRPSMHSGYSDEARQKETKLGYSAEATSSAKLLLDKVSLFDSAGEVHSLINLFFHNMLENLRNDLRSGAKCSAGSMVAEERNPLRQLLLDCMIECLDSLCSCFYYAGCKAWFRFQLFLSKNRLAKFVEEEIIRWHDMAGKSVVELVQQDMLHANTDWPAFKTGRYELSEQVEEDTLELVINELVVDLSQC